MNHKILRLPDVKAVTGLGRSSIYCRVSKGEFPTPIKLGSRTVGWVEDEIQNWLQRRIEESRRREVEQPVGKPSLCGEQSEPK